MHSLGRDIKAETQAVYALASTAATAAGSGDATEVDGATINKATLGFRAESVVFSVAATATLTAAKTLTLTANLQDSANGSSWADITDPAVILTLTATGTGVGRLGYDLNKTRQYVRIQCTPDLSHTSTDTAVMFGIATFGGIQQIS